MKFLKNNIILIVLIVAVSLYLLAAVAASSSLDNCTRTSTTKSSTFISLVGRLMLPITTTRRLYVCPDGRRLWL